MKEFFTLSETATYFSGIYKSPVSELDIIILAKREALPICFEFDGDISCVTITRADGTSSQPGLSLPFSGILKSLVPPDMNGRKINASLVEIVEYYCQGFSHRDGKLTKGFALPTKDQLANGYTVTGFVDFEDVPSTLWLFHITDLDNVSGEINGPAPTVPQPESAPLVKKGVIKDEILCLEWPMPNGAPSLESILDKIPQWVGCACIKVGQVGKGKSGSHLWNPAMLAVCLASKTPQKKWVGNKLALTNFMRSNFSDYFSEWESYSERL